MLHFPEYERGDYQFSLLNKWFFGTGHAGQEQLSQQDLKAHEVALKTLEASPLRSAAAPIQGKLHSTPSKWGRFKEAILLLFKVLGKAFSLVREFKNPQHRPAWIRKEYFGPNGELIGKENIERKRGISDLLDSKQAECLFLAAQGEGIKLLEDEIERYKELAKTDTWATANRVRDQGANFLRKTAPSPKEVYIPAVVNNRTHQIHYTENGLERRVAINRSGAISHMADGDSNLKALIEAGDIQKIGERRRILSDQMIQYIKGQVEVMAEEIKDPDSLTHRTGTLQIIQVGLFNPLHAKIEKGIVLNEENQMLDMAEIFKEFNGKEIIFDNVSAPFLYGDKIVMPIACIGNEHREQNLKLSCTFFNCSVQGLAENKGSQAIVNANAINTIKVFLNQHRDVLRDSHQAIRERLRTIEDRLNRGETGYEIAKEIILFQHDLKGASGVNCFSGKDRTGYLLAMIADHYLSKSLDKFTGKEKQNAMRALRQELTNPYDSAVSQIIEENTGHKFMKIEARLLMWINAPEDHNGIPGHLLRVAYAANAYFTKS